MKKTILMIGAMVLMSGTAMAETQIYNPHSTNAGQYTYSSQTTRAAQLQGGAVDKYAGAPRVYRGREVYGQNFGPMPRHPGDYRDAVDRGTWTGGGGGVSHTGRSFDVR